MKKTLFAGLSALVLLTTCFVSSAFALEFGARANYWIPVFYGEMRIDRNGITGTEIKLKDDLGISNENIPSVEAYFGTDNHEITLMYSQVNLSGKKNIERSIVFDGNTYNVGAYVESELNTKMIELEYQYKLLNFKNILAGLSIGIIGKVKYFNGEARLRSTTAGSAYDSKENINVPIPLVGLGVKIGLLSNILEARAKATCMGYAGNFFYDAMGDIAVTPFPFIDIHGGYRAMSIKIDNVSNVYTKMDFAGPYVGIAINF